MNTCNRFLISMLAFLLLQICLSTDTISFNESITDGKILVSSGGNFTLGFFSPGNSSNRYLGIWYAKVSVQTVVWIANRDDLINDTSGVLSINGHGNLILYSKNQTIPVWFTNVSASSTSTSVAQLLNSGNFILSQSDSATVLWKSIDHPTNTMLPFTTLGLDKKTGLNRFLTSWKSLNDPGTGEWSYYLEPSGLPEMVLYKGQVPWWRSGPWDGLMWNGIAEMSTHFLFNTSIMYSNNETAISWGIVDSSVISMLFLDVPGQVKRANWNARDQRWNTFWTVPTEKCDYYGHCGPNGNCNPYNSGVFECSCLPGFEPRFLNDWNLKDGSGGCVRKHGAVTCRSGEGFVTVKNSKVPDTSMVLVDMSMSLQACQDYCLRNCSCTAYAYFRRGSGCVTWSGDLLDTRVFTDVGQDIYIRVDAETLAQYTKTSKGFLAKKGGLAALLTPLALAFIGFISITYYLKKRKRNDLFIDDTSSLTNFEEQKKEDFEESSSSKLPVFDIKTITSATENFSFGNKLGQGGFGSVYKGRLPHGQDIAVKRLSKNSRQGVQEFKNEVRLISKLQHKNLVRLLGCCIYKEEKMLVYEYLPNKSLDFFIFDKTKSELLDWRQRFEIILGIARGLLYLHQDSRLKIIHRDLKAGNVLLDAAMNPKISDFGMARIFGEDQIEANTTRVVGTYGYMSPEYAMEGLYSMKSDVFSYGVLVLEIISGRKNNDYYDESTSQNLIAQVWDLRGEGRALELVDILMGDSYPGDQVLRCIQIGLLCVQESAMDRPSMSNVVFMLSNDTNPSTSEASHSINEVTITMLGAR
ncbi:G-type lectin S-receptor serine/threonine-protein kinase [Salix suchowensis]|nr:G-type lectin S-receptor serine/threonine-protein kinase [Salix suchowensis]